MGGMSNHEQFLPTMFCAPRAHELYFSEVLNSLDNIISAVSGEMYTYIIIISLLKF